MYILLFILVFIPIGSFSQEIGSLTPKNGGNVGDIPYDPTLDDSTFSLCKPGYVAEYYSVSGGYRGGRKKLLHLLKELKLDRAASSSPSSGYITIRFLVNCQGKTDRFRMLQVDEGYSATSFPADLINAVLLFTKNLTDWLPGKHEKESYDYFQYLTFKISDGIPVDILP